jgi:L-proline amide hydrolase
MLTTEQYVVWRLGTTWVGTISGVWRENPPVLVVNGGPGSSHCYCTHIAELLSMRGRTVYLYDQLGTGTSEISEEVESIDWNQDLFLEELAAVCKSCFTSGYVILGHSWGSSLAMEFAARRPEGLVGLVLCSGAASMDRWIESIAERRLELPEELLAIAAEHELAGTLDSIEYKEVARYYDTHFVSRVPVPPSLYDVDANCLSNLDAYQRMWGPTEFNVNGTLRSWDILNLLERIEVPALYIAGRYDNISSAHSEEIVRLIPNAMLLKYEYSSSMAFHEEPARFQDDVATFLDGLSTEYRQ